jgi:hypothetical protein
MAEFCHALTWASQEVPYWLTYRGFLKAELKMWQNSAMADISMCLVLPRVHSQPASMSNALGQGLVSKASSKDQNVACFMLGLLLAMLAS